MTNETQIDQVKKEIEQTGFISRNWCLQRYISRLSDIIFKLKKQGYEFETFFMKTAGGGKDFVYKVKSEAHRPIMINKENHVEELVSGEEHKEIINEKDRQVPSL